MGKGRAPCCDKSKVKRGPWSPNEDLRLITFIQKHGHDNWRALPKLAGLMRCGKSCRLRWINYLRPDVKRGNFTNEEEENIIKLHQTLGNKWSKIASHFPGRTDNEIKNVWNTHLKKRLSKKNDPSGNESNKESTVTTSSSSSSASSHLSTRKRISREVLLVEEESGLKRLCGEDKLTSQESLNNEDDDDDDDHVEKQVMIKEFSPQLANDPKEQVISTTTSLDSSYGSNVSNGTTSTTQVNNSRQDDHEENLLMENLLFNFEEPCDVSDLLCEVNKPNINIEETSVVLDQALMPLEANNDFWDIFDSFDTNIFDNIDQVQVLDNISEPLNNSIFVEQNNKIDDENKKWLRYLESELGLEGTTTANEDQNPLQQVLELDQSHAFEEVIASENSFRNEIEVTKPEPDPTRLDFSPTYQLWLF